MKGPLLILVKTLTTKFGAYSDKGLDEVGGWRKSSNSYLFGINDNIPIISPVISSKKHMALYFDKKQGVIFGNRDLHLNFDLIDDKNVSTSKLGGCYQIPKGGGAFAFAGNEFGRVEPLEVEIFALCPED